MEPTQSPRGLRAGTAALAALAIVGGVWLAVSLAPLISGMLG